MSSFLVESGYSLARGCEDGTKTFTHVNLANETQARSLATQEPGVWYGYRQHRGRCILDFIVKTDGGEQPLFTLEEAR